MERNYAFDPETIGRIRTKLTWAQLEIDPTRSSKLKLMISGDDESVEELRVEDGIEGLLVAQPQLGYAKELLPRNRWLQISLRLPADWHGDLDADTVAGTISAHVIEGGDVAFNSVSGSINVRDIKARSLWLHTVAGAIAGTCLEAQRANLRSISGPITLGEAAFGSTKLFTISGHVTLDMLPSCHTLDAQSVSGSLAVQTDGPVRPTLHSLSGQFVLTGDVPQGDGGLEISASSVSGDLTVNRREQKEENA